MTATGVFAERVSMTTVSFVSTNTRPSAATATDRGAGTVASSSTLPVAGSIHRMASCFAKAITS